MLHEFGHFFAGALGFPAEHERLFRAEGESAPLRNYAKTDSAKYFADCFAYWIAQRQHTGRGPVSGGSAPDLRLFSGPCGRWMGRFIRQFSTCTRDLTVPADAVCHLCPPGWQAFPPATERLRGPQPRRRLRIWDSPFSAQNCKSKAAVRKDCRFCMALYFLRRCFCLRPLTCSGWRDRGRRRSGRGCRCCWASVHRRCPERSR